MRYAIISDIHSNLEALTVALRHIDGARIDRVLCLGDIVGYGPDPVECLRLVREATSIIVMGNHDEAVNDYEQTEYFNSVARQAIEWTTAELPDEQKAFLRGLPYSIPLDDMLLVHSAPQFPYKWEYIFSAFEARLYANSFPERLCFVGHSHLPGIYAMSPGVQEYTPDHRFIINVGSVGQPRDGDPRLSFGILDTVAGSYETVRLEYDATRTALRIMEKGLPRYLAERILVGR